MPGRLLWTRRLGLTCVVLTFLLMGVGAWVKATGSGLACPDWPSCWGQWAPPFPSMENGGQVPGIQGDVADPAEGYTQAQILYEWTHRAIVALIGVPVLAFAIVALRGRSFRPALRRLPAAAVGVLVLQAGLGAVTVVTGNPPWATTMHLAVAVLWFAMLLTATCIAFLAPHPPVAPMAARPPPPASPHPAFAPGATAGFVFSGEERAQPAGEDGHGR